ncbi:carbon-monoxide dehydrogenase, catalytic subunit [Candidatus Magnetobacterium bavaricum]|uniref:Carbon monoxide dehydrogenase n=1 Tax=Candidatus Magnetobacterium bavaricum TaxID=29290 RepID=A0A0F3GZD0_9BACT|nr:carbon-monoxide dehydrogenase, catalytic subunit [Candidatus Magnetobacterium bavaricum]
MAKLEIFQREKSFRQKKRTGDPATQHMIDYVEGLGLDCVFTRQKRYEDKLLGVISKSGRCDFGLLGICCRQCLMGPCRIWHKDVDTPLRINAPMQSRGTCGATADTIVARNWLVYHSRGCAAHSTTCKEVAETLLKTARGQTTYELKDTNKLKDVSLKLGINGGASNDVIAQEIALIALSDIMGKPDGLSNKDGMRFANAYLPPKVVARLKELEIMPTSSFEDLADADHQAVIGMMTDPYYFIMQSLKIGVADIIALLMTTEIHDILLGTPTPVATKIGINVLNEKMVNIAVHGHIPTLAEKIIHWSDSREFKDKARLAGADGINIVGVCCTGAEVLQRHKIALAGNNLQEDLLIATGVVDAFLMDVQCSYPSTHNMAHKFHTKIITTMKDARVPDADHIPFRAESADEWAKQVLDLAISNFAKRPNKVHLPPYEPVDAICGFSVEACVGVLSKLDAVNPLKPLIDNIVNGNIYGVCLVASCNTPKLTTDDMYNVLVRELSKHNVLVIATGCAAGSCGRGGMLNTQATARYTGDKLKAVLTAIGQAAGLDQPLPPVWHMGSCVDNSRAVNLASALAVTLGTGFKELPIVVSAAEAVTEKAVSIGSGAVALGFPVHVSVVPPVLGSPMVSKLLTVDLKELTGGFYIVEPDPLIAAKQLLGIITEKRKALNLPVN